MAATAAVLPAVSLWHPAVPLVSLVHDEAPAPLSAPWFQRTAVPVLPGLPPTKALRRAVGQQATR